MKEWLYEAQVTWTQAFIVIVFLWFIWAGIRDIFLTAIRAVGGITILLGTNHKNR